MRIASSGWMCLCVMATSVVQAQATSAQAKSTSVAASATSEPSDGQMERPALERVFVDAQAGFWLPGPWTFNDSHTMSFGVGFEAGAQVIALNVQHHVYVTGALMLSPQTLEQYLGADASTLVMPSAGVRYINAAVCMHDRRGCPFAELNLGLAFEITSDDDEHHRPPQGAWTAGLAIGYRHRLSGNAHVGARLDFVYLDDGWTRELAWLSPTLFAGASL